MTPEFPPPNVNFEPCIIYNIHHLDQQTVLFKVPKLWIIRIRDRQSLSGSVGLGCVTVSIQPEGICQEEMNVSKSRCVDRSCSVIIAATVIQPS